MFYFIFCTLGRCSDAEEQWQCLGSCNEEDTCAYDHHDLLFHVLLLVVHGDVNRDRTDDGNDTCNGVAELHHDRHILGYFLRNAQYLYKSLIYSIGFRV